MTRPSEVTRDRIMKAAERLFAEKGYDSTSIRAIVAKARVNQAAINYHFDGKDGLYREVLAGGVPQHDRRTSSRMPQDVKTLSREEALDRLHPPPASPADGARRIEPPHAHLQLGNRAADAGVRAAWSPRRRRPFMNMAAEIVRRFLPDADRKTLTVASIWLIGQCSVFLRNRERLAEPPIGLQLDDAMVEWLGDAISRWIVAGLGAGATPPAGTESFPAVSLDCGKPGNVSKIP